MKLLIFTFIITLSSFVTNAKPIEIKGGFPYKNLKVKRWLSQIASTEIGKRYLDFVQSGDFQVNIVNGPRAELILRGGARVLNYPNATELDIDFDMSMGDEGVMEVKGEYKFDETYKKWIPFPAVVLLFHEISHVYHVFNDSEADLPEVQAILDENIFRKQYAEANGTPVYQRSLNSHRAGADRILPEREKSLKERALEIYRVLTQR